MSKLWKCIFGPALYCRYECKLGPIQRFLNYNPSTVEDLCSRFTKACTVSKFVLIYTSPLWIYMLYKRELFTLHHGNNLLTYSLWFGAFYLSALLMRGISRYHNPEYMHFLSVLQAAENNPGNAAPMNKLRFYDFEFSHWPINFQAKSGDHGYMKRNSPTLPPHDFTGRLRKCIDNHKLAMFLVRGLPCEILSFLLGRLVGVSLMYPGSTTLLSAALGPALRQGRTKLIQMDGGIRAKVMLVNGIFIDTMFINRRINCDSRDCNKSNTLVICCEGNAGFYEVGCMCTPMEEGYSVLGWNHPGFAESSGSPFPSNEILAVDAMVQYAFALGFTTKNIILFGWSIGAYSAVQAAAMYPDIKGVFLDATFDDVLQLAVHAMPKSFEGIVKRTIRGYLNLNNGEVLTKYNGPVHFVRRSGDEVMNTVTHDSSTNVGNPLVVRLLRHRYPRLFGFEEEEKDEILSVVETWLCADSFRQRDEIMRHWEVREGECEDWLRTYVYKYQARFPADIGTIYPELQKKKLLLYLLNKHISFYDSTHCPPLPGALFGQPWDVLSVLSSSASKAQPRADDQYEEFEVVE